MRPPRGLLLAILLGAVARAEGPAAAPPAWRLAPSDAAIYDLAEVTLRDGAERRGRTEPRVVRGGDVREGQVRPVDPGLDDLPLLLALRLPEETGSGPGRAEMRLDLPGAPTVLAKGTLRSETQADGRLRIDGDWSLASRGRLDAEHDFLLRAGRASVQAAFDPARGVFVSARVSVAYERVKAEPARGDRPSDDVARTWVLTLREVRPPRYEGFDAEVGAAIDRGVAWLRTKQQPDGSWPRHHAHEVGPAALAALTLAECGVPREDPAVERTLAFLVGRYPPHTYDRALALMALDRAYTPPAEEDLIRSGRVTTRTRNLPPDRRAWAERVAAQLEADVESPGSWGYPSAANALLKFDSSNTQYGALGLRAASRLSIPVSETSWMGVIRHFQLVRERKAPPAALRLGREGDPAPKPGETVAPAPPLEVEEAAGFLYSTRESRIWASMTCAGIASLELARHELARTGSRKLGPREAAAVEAAIRGGWAWLDGRFAVDRHPGKPGNDWWHYYLYSLERAAIFSGVRTVGGRDWYADGALELLLRQKDDGSWAASGGNDLTSTCFALLFLKRATAPLTAGG